MRKLLFIIVFILVSFVPVRADGITPEDGYFMRLPLVLSGSYGLDRYVTAGFPFWPEEQELWCNNGYPCTQVETLNKFRYRSPDGRAITFVRLYLAYLFPPDGAHIIYPYDGCLFQICVWSGEGNLQDRPATRVEVYIDPTQPGPSGTIHLADFMYTAARPASIMVVKGKYYDTSVLSTP